MEARQDCLNNQGDLVKIDSVAEKVDILFAITFHN
jgi:hypothetical protein